MVELLSDHSIHALTLLKEVALRLINQYTWRLCAILPKNESGHYSNEEGNLVHYIQATTIGNIMCCAKRFIVITHKDKIKKRTWYADMVSIHTKICT